MGWGCYGHGVPQSARDVAKAFYAGKNCSRTNCYSTGESYVLLDTVIANRVKDEDVANEVALALKGASARRLLIFSYNGYGTRLTARHLSALGITAEVRRVGPRGGRYDVCLINGKRVDPEKWYSHEDLACLPTYEEPTPAPRPPRFVNLSMELFA
jgi:hypothetical protein